MAPVASTSASTQGTGQGHLEANPIPTDVQPLIELDPYLGPYKGALEWR